MNRPLIWDKQWLPLYREMALTKQHGRCLYCYCPLTVRTATADHKRPQTRHGRTRPDNIAAACWPCNQAKADLSEGAFFRLIKGRQPPRGASVHILLVWSARRIWKRTHKACQRIRETAE